MLSFSTVTVQDEVCTWCKNVIKKGEEATVSEYIDCESSEDNKEVYLTRVVWWSHNFNCTKIKKS